jgi:hypothetical protein
VPHPTTIASSPSTVKVQLFGGWLKNEALRLAFSALRLARIVETLNHEDVEAARAELQALISTLRDRKARC